MEILYILGTTRSGTSAIRNAIAQTRFSGYGEGHVVPILQGIVATVRNSKARGVGADVEGTGLFRLREHILLRHLFHGYENYLMEAFGRQSILDKTPTIEPILAAPDLNTFHKDPKFVYCSRRHIDNIMSKTKKFPEKCFSQHCVEWARCAEAWEQVRPKLRGNCFEFDFYDLVNHVENTAEQIGQYLELTTDEVDCVRNYLLVERPQGKPDRDLTKFIKFSDVGWSQEEKASFLEICGPVGERLGYGLESYFV